MRRLRSSSSARRQDEAVGNLEAGCFESCRGPWIDGRRANRGHRRGFGSERVEPRSQFVDARQRRHRHEGGHGRARFRRMRGAPPGNAMHRTSGGSRVRHGTGALRRGSSVQPVTVLFATHPTFLEHRTGCPSSGAAGTPRGGGQSDRSASARRGDRAARAAPGKAIRTRARPPDRGFSTVSTISPQLAVGGSMPTRRRAHSPRPPPPSLPGPDSRRSKRLQRGEARRRVLCRATARTSCDAHRLDGLLPRVEHRRGGGLARRRRRTGVDLRLRRPSRKRHGGGVL